MPTKGARYGHLELILLLILILKCESVFSRTTMDAATTAANLVDAVKTGDHERLRELANFGKAAVHLAATDDDDELTGWMLSFYANPSTDAPPEEKVAIFNAPNATLVQRRADLPRASLDRLSACWGDARPS